MTTWQRAEHFCVYVRRRRLRRAMWLKELYAGAANEYSRQLVDKLAQRWQATRPSIAGGKHGFTS